MKNLKSLFTSKAMRKGSYSMSMIVIVLAIVILVNLFVGQLPERYKNIDITPWDIYSVTDTSKDVLKELNKDVTITIVGETGTIDERIERFIEIYASMSSHIQVEYLDPARHPGVVSDLGTESGSVYVSCEETGKSRNIIAADMIEYSMDYTYYSYVETGFDAEGQLTSAVYYVTNTESPKLYYTEGHGESTLSTTVTDMFGKNNLEYTSLNLTKQGAIPEDCDVLFVYEPQKDLSETELSILQNYLAQGGKITILFGQRNVEMPNFSTLLAEYGMNLLEGYVADLSSFYQNNYFAVFPEIQSVDGITSNLNSDAMVLGYYSTGMELGTAARDTITVESFLQTTEDGYLVDGEEQTQGVYVLGAVATETVTLDGSTTEKTEDSNGGFIKEENVDVTLAVEEESNTETDDTTDSEPETDEETSEITEEHTAQLTVFTCANLLNENFTSSASLLDNTTVFMNAITCNLDNVDNISIPSKSLELSYVVVHNSMLWAVLYVVIIPVSLIVIGLGIWIKRKRA